MSTKKKILLIAGLWGVSNAWGSQSGGLGDLFAYLSGGFLFVDNSETSLYPEAQSGTVDNTFGSSGKQTYTGTESILKIVSIGVLGYVVAGANGSDQFIKYIKSDGTVDTTVDLSVSSGTVKGLAYDGSGTVYVAITGASSTLYIYAYDLAGNLVTTFGTNGIKTIANISDMTDNMIYTDGALFIAVTNNASGSVHEIYKIDSTGTVSWSSDMGALPAQIRAYGNYIYAIRAGSTYQEILRFNKSDLAQDTGSTFGSSGVVDTTIAIATAVKDMLVDTNGNMYVCYTITASTEGKILKFNAAGTQITDSTWGTSGVVTISSLATPMQLIFGALNVFMYVVAKSGSDRKVWALDGAGATITKSSVIATNPFTVTGASTTGAMGIVLDNAKRLVLGGISSSLGSLWRYTNYVDSDTRVSLIQSGGALGK